MEKSSEKPEIPIASINQDHLKGFQIIPFDKRILFISHCIRAEQKDEIKKFAEALGYKVHVVGGGSIVLKIIEKESPQAVIGIACYPELEMAVEKLKTNKVPLQIVPLETDGCKDTTVNMDEVKRILAIYIPANSSPSPT